MAFGGLSNPRFCVLLSPALTKALAATEQAVEFAKKGPGIFPISWVYWTRYEVLKQAAAASEQDDGSSAAVATLHLALDSLLHPLKTTRDPGLRRSYLHRIEPHRQILETSLELITDRTDEIHSLISPSADAEDLRALFRRMLDFGTRLAAHDEFSELPRFILHEFVELSGAERAWIAQVENQDLAPLIIQQIGFNSGEDQGARLAVRSEVEQALLAGHSLITHLKHETKAASFSASRSVLLLPLKSKAGLQGLLYADVSESFGPFRREDSQLLTIFADQAAAAFENARWTETLQEQVEARTSELSTLNLISDSLLASKLDFDATVNLVADKVQDWLKNDNLAIGFLNQDRTAIDFPYLRGNRETLRGYQLKMGQGLSSIVIETGMPLLIQTLAEAEKAGTVWPRGEVDFDEFFWLGVPLVFQDAVRGIIFTAENRNYHYRESDLRLFETVAGNMVVALENARLFDETQDLLEQSERRAEELTTINLISEGLLAKTDLDGILQLVGEHLQQQFGTNNSLIGFYDAKQSTIAIPYHIIAGERQEATVMSEDEGLSSHVLRNNAPLLINSLEEGEALGGVYPTGVEGSIDEMSWIGVPLRRHGEAIGLIVVGELRDHAYDQSHVDLLSTIAANLGVALENARLFDETQSLLSETESRNAELGLLNRIQQELLDEADLATIYEVVGEAVREITDSQVVVIFRFDVDQRINYYEYTFEKGARFHIEPQPFTGVIDDLVAGQKTMLVNEGVAEFSGSQVSGAITLPNVDREHAFNEGHARLLETLAASLSGALDNARLLAETQERNAELAVINRIQDGLVEKADFDAIVELVTQEIAEIFNAETAYLWTLDSSQTRVTAGYYFESGDGTFVHDVPIDPGLSTHIISTAEPLRFGSAAEMDSSEIDGMVHNGQKIS